MWPSPYGLPDYQPLRHLTDHQPSSPHSNRLQPTNRVSVSSWMCFITANRIALTCALSTLKRACSASSSYTAFYISILQKGFRYLTQPCSGAALVLHSHDSRRCTGYANRYSRPVQPSPAQPENTPLAYCAPHSCCSHVHSEANGEIGGDKTASCYSVSPRCTALLPKNPVYCCKNAETLD